jgi:hypothetical protein
MNLKELAATNGISVSTAKRYKREGVDLTDAQAVNAYKHTQRTRFGLSKLAHRAKGMQKAAVSDRIDELEDVIAGVHFALVVLKLQYPDLAENIQAITKITGPVIDRMTEEL